MSSVLYGAIFFCWKVFPEAYLELSWMPEAKIFVKIVNSFQWLIFFMESSVLDVWLGFEYVSVFFNRLHFLIYEVDLD